MHERSWTEKDVIKYMRGICSHTKEALNLLDDCAIIPKYADEFWLISKDSCVESVHFDERYFLPQEIGHKAFHTTVSDIAAMGGNAEFIMLAISLPKGLKETYVEALFQGFIDCAKKSHVKILGGDTTRSPGAIFLSATVIGSVKKDHLKKRSTAQEGNLLAVSGNFGYSALGLRMLGNPKLIKKYPALIAAQKTPTALLEKGAYLGKSAVVTAMLDVSDGILKDAENLGIASDLLVHLDCKKIPLPKIIVDGAHELGLCALKTVLEGGEDYGLMVALDHKQDEHVLSELISAAGLVEIGYFSHGKPGVVLENMPISFEGNPPVVFEHGG